MVHVHLRIKHVEPLLHFALPQALLAEPRRYRQHVDRAEITTNARDDELHRAERRLTLLQSVEAYEPDGKGAESRASRQRIERRLATAEQFSQRPVAVRRQHTDDRFIERDRLYLQPTTRNADRSEEHTSELQSQ